MNVLAIGPHPDDIEYYSAGTLVKYAQSGHKITMAVITNGDKGSMGCLQKEIEKTRKTETEKSAEIINADLIWVGKSDGELFHSEELRNEFIDIIRMSEADVIICSSPNDYHPDHIVCSRLTQESSVLSTVPLIKTKHKPLKENPYIFFNDHLGGMNFYPDEYVDIVDTFEVKKQMLLCHESQKEWLKAQYSVEMLYSMEIVARFRGLACKSLFAEGFLSYKSFPGYSTKRLLP